MGEILDQRDTMVGLGMLTDLSWLLGGTGVILLLVWSVRRLRNRGTSAGTGAPLAILQQRYARGEIGTEEYERMRLDLFHSPGSCLSSRRRDHTLLLVGLGTLAFGLLSLLLGCCSTWRPTLFDATQRAARAVASPWEGRASGQVNVFKLTVDRLQWELEPGNIVEAYAYNGQVPGPELRVTEGDTVRVMVTNMLPEPTTIHWHGVEVPVAMDGVPRRSQEPIPPGGSFTYEFVATPAGTRWYHAHFNELTQQGGGLVGALIIEPRAAVSPPPDREYVLVTGEWTAGVGPARDSALPPPATSDGMMGEGGMDGMLGLGAGRHRIDTFTINGKAYPTTAPLLVREGERVRLRLINAGATATQAFALAGHTLMITHLDGNPVNQPVNAEAVLLGVGERADVEFVADNPGRWQLRGLLPGHADRGLAVDVVYAGHEADAVQSFPVDARLRPARYADLGGPQYAARPDRTYALTLSGGMMGSPVWTINGRSYPETEPLQVRPGERVRLKLFNMSMADHPMHLHGHTFQVVAIGDQPINGPRKDTLTLRHMEQYEIEFVANNPGIWLFHCHNLEHMGGGMMTEVHYRELGSW
jgi:multicopper oxidase